MSELPFHPLTGLQALGFRKDGREIWPVLGGSEDAEDAGSGDDEGGEDLTPPVSKNWWNFQSQEDAQEWVNDKITKRVGREKSKMDAVAAERDTLKAEVERLKPLEDATKTDAQRWESEKSSITAELEELRSFRTKTERANLVREIAEDKGLPAKFVKYVVGDDADSITQSVEDVLNDLSEVGPPKKPAQRKPKETDGDEPGDKGSGGGGSGSDDGWSVESVLEEVRKNRGSTYAH